MRDQADEAGRADAQVSVFAKRQRIRAAGVSVLPAENDQRARMVDGQRTQQQRIDDREHGEVRADAEGERRCGHGGERGTAPQEAEREAHVGDKIFRPRHPPHIAGSLLDVRDIPEGPARGPFGLRPRHPGRHQRRDLLVEVRADLRL
jgi:hypothetical protein